MEEDVRRSSCCLLQIPVLMQNLEKCIDTLNTAGKCTYRYQYVSTIRHGRYQLIKVINAINQVYGRKKSMSSKEEINRAIFEAQFEYESEETKIGHLRKEWSIQQDTMAKLQESLYRKCRLLSLHSDYCSCQGSSLCSILALVMEDENLVESLLEEQDIYLVDFVKIADGCLASFIRTYCSDTPIDDSPDYKYILALYSCIAYISSLHTGREFLLNSSACSVMLQEMVKDLPRVTHPITEKLKLVLLKILHDVSLHGDAGRNFLQRKCSGLLTALGGCLRQDYQPEAYKYVLEILIAVTKEIKVKQYLDDVTKFIDSRRLKELSGSLYREVSYLPRRILQNINRAAVYVRALEDRGDAAAAGRKPCTCKRCSRLASRRRLDTPQPTQPKKVTTRQVFRIPQQQKSARFRTVQRVKSSKSCVPPSSFSSCAPTVSQDIVAEFKPSETCPYCACMYQQAPKQTCSPSRPSSKSKKAGSRRSIPTCPARTSKYRKSDSYPECPAKRRTKKYPSDPSSRVCSRGLESSSNLHPPAFSPGIHDQCSIQSDFQQLPSSASSPKQIRLYLPPSEVFNFHSKSRDCSCTPCNFKRTWQLGGSSTEPSRPGSQDSEFDFDIIMRERKSGSYCAFTDHILPRPMKARSSHSLAEQEMIISDTSVYEAPTEKRTDMVMKSGKISGKKSVVCGEKDGVYDGICRCAGVAGNVDLLGAGVLGGADPAVPACTSPGKPDATGLSGGSAADPSGHSTTDPCGTDALGPDTLQDRAALDAISTLSASLCTCPCVSERSLVPYNPENRMLAFLHETDRRVNRNYVRVTSRIVGNNSPRQQQIITRVRIRRFPFGNMNQRQGSSH